MLPATASSAVAAASRALEFTRVRPLNQHPVADMAEIPDGESADNLGGSDPDCLVARAHGEFA